MEERSELNFERKKVTVRAKAFCSQHQHEGTNVICRSRILIKLTGKRLRE